VTFTPKFREADENLRDCYSQQSNSKSASVRPEPTARDEREDEQDNKAENDVLHAAAVCI
jgi:hypothetical protein